MILSHSHNNDTDKIEPEQDLERFHQPRPHFWRAVLGNILQDERDRDPESAKEKRFLGIIQGLLQRSRSKNEPCGDCPTNRNKCDDVDNEDDLADREKAGELVGGLEEDDGDGAGGHGGSEPLPCEGLDELWELRLALAGRELVRCLVVGLAVFDDLGYPAGHFSQRCGLSKTPSRGALKERYSTGRS